MNLLDKAQGTLTVLRSLPGQRRATYLPREQLVAHRDERVRETVEYAAATVPYYRDLFRSDGIDPREIRTAGDLERLPLVDKLELRADPTRFTSTDPRARERLTYSTTGTTGVPVEIAHDRASLLDDVAYAERERVIESRFVGKRVRYLRISISDLGGAGNRTRAYYRRSMFAPLRPRRESLSSSAPLEQTIADVNRLQPDLIRGHGSFLELLYRTVAARGLRMHRPKVLVYGGDVMTPDGRRFIEQDVGIPVISRYNAIESFKIGFQCEERSAFHLHDDLCHLRVIDSEGRTVPDGTRGEVVISNLVNRGTVLLNYRLADLATIVHGPCGCGRTTRMLSELEGRLSEIIQLTDGTLIVPVAVWQVVKPFDEVIRYQLVQVERERFELSLVTADEAAFDRSAGPLAAAMSQLLGGARVEPVYRELAGSPGLGKFKRVIALPPEGTS
jgi:phenylacetate-coenzyme A ligase PaaK-like adenylate-forming protein